MPISVLSINSMTQSVHVRQCERELCVYFKSCITCPWRIQPIVVLPSQFVQSVM